MITNANKGLWLIAAVESAGESLWYEDDVSHSTNDAVVQPIVDAFDPLPFAKSDALARVKQSAADKYAQYASSAPGKDAVYSTKQAEAVAHYNNGANDGPVGPYMQARINLTGETATAISAEWRAKSAAWNALAAAIDAIQDNASAQINAATDWTSVDAIASAALTAIEALG